MDSNTLITLLSKRIRDDLALINGLSSSALGQSPKASDELVSLSLHIRCISLGTEALFIDASIDRINIIRHLQTIVSTLVELSSLQSTFTHTDPELFCDARRATLVGLALGDLIWRLGRVAVKLEQESEGSAICIVSLFSVKVSLEHRAEFAQNIIETALGSKLRIEEDQISFSFLL